MAQQDPELHELEFFKPGLRQPLGILELIEQAEQVGSRIASDGRPVDATHDTFDHAWAGWVMHS